MFEFHNFEKMFSEVPINTKEIPQAELNIDVRKRTNLFSWNGQFSPQFVEAELLHYSRTDFCVIDPFAGSGTTLHECARLGLTAYGVELNPAAYLMAKTYELTGLSISERNLILTEIEKQLNRRIPDEDIVAYLTSLIKNEDQKTSHVLSVLVILLDIFKAVPTYSSLRIKWDNLKTKILELPFCHSSIHVFHSDARHISLPDNMIDLLFTSPPYINVFNYHQNYRRSAEALGYNILQIAKSEFGANRKNRGNRFLTVIQYCIDMAEALQEAVRVCKSNSRLIFVVGRESCVLGYSFCNSELVYRLGTEVLGLIFDIRQERVFKNRYGQWIFEDILHFYNMKKGGQREISDIIEHARRIAIDMLKNRYDKYRDNKNSTILLEAIDNAEFVLPSEVVL